MLFTIIIATAQQLAIDIVESGHWCLEIALVINDYQFARKNLQGKLNRNSG
jgi:hypothetical protein